MMDEALGIGAFIGIVVVAAVLAIGEVLYRTKPRPPRQAAPGALTAADWAALRDDFEKVVPFSECSDCGERWWGTLECPKCVGPHIGRK